MRRFGRLEKESGMNPEKLLLERSRIWRDDKKSMCGGRDPTNKLEERLRVVSFVQERRL